MEKGSVKCLFNINLPSQKDYGKVIEFIEKTSCYQNQLANPRDSGLVYFIKSTGKRKVSK